jgi:hypothetical protein
MQQQYVNGPLGRHILVYRQSRNMIPWDERSYPYLDLYAVPGHMVNYNRGYAHFLVLTCNHFHRVDIRISLYRLCKSLSALCGIIVFTCCVFYQVP